MAGILSGCAGITEAQEQTVWRFGHEEVAGAVMDEYAYEFKRLVEEKSNGEIKVEVYRANEIGGVTDYLEFVQGGLLDFAIVNPGTSATTIPENNIFYNHFLLPADDRELQDFLNNSEGVQMLNKVNEEHEMKVLDWFYEGFNTWTANHAIRKPEDFDGVRIRTMASPLIVKSYEAYGANPTPMPYMEVYSGLQLKQIDAQVNPMFAIQEMGFYEVQETIINAKQDSFVASLVANKEQYEDFDQGTKDMLDEIIPELNEFIFQTQKRLNEERLEIIKENSDIEVIELTDEEREAFREASQPVREVFRNSVGERGNEILDVFEKELEELREQKAQESGK